MLLAKSLSIPKIDKSKSLFLSFLIFGLRAPSVRSVIPFVRPWYDHVH